MSKLEKSKLEKTVRDIFSVIYYPQTPFSSCRDEAVVENIFGSISEFARLVEVKGNNFIARGVRVVYDEKNDIHYFFSVE